MTCLVNDEPTHALPASPPEGTRRADALDVNEQLFRVGVTVARTSAMDSEIAVLAFARNGTNNPDAFVVVNLGRDKQVSVTVKGSAAKSFAAFRTTEDGKDNYAGLGELSLVGGALRYEAPAGSVTSFFAVE
jgi:hypothetical protein